MEQEQQSNPKQEEKISVQQLYDFITTQMSPEEALKKLLSTTVEQYSQLRTLEGETGSPYMIIALATMELGWNIAVEQNQEQIRGLSIGTEEYLKSLFEDDDVPGDQD